MIKIDIALTSYLSDLPYLGYLKHSLQLK